MTIKEIDEQMMLLKIERDRLYKQEIENFKKDAKKNIGRCFKTKNGEYVKVIGIPQEEITMTGYRFNEYQYPALFLVDEIQPFEIDTLFTAAWENGHFQYDGTYEEITKEEFNAEFEKKLESFKHNVMSC